MYKIFLIFLSFNFLLIFPQPTHQIMSCNSLNYSGSIASERNPYFSVVFSNTNPDLLVIQEISSQAGVNRFLNNVLILINPHLSSTFNLSTAAAYNLAFSEIGIIAPEIEKIISKEEYES